MRLHSIEFLGFHGPRDGEIAFDPLGTTVLVARACGGKTRACRLIEALLLELSGQSTDGAFAREEVAKAVLSWHFDEHEETFIPQDAERVTEVFVGAHPLRGGVGVPDAATTLARRRGYKVSRVDAESAGRLPDALHERLLDHVLGVARTDALQAWIDWTHEHTPVRVVGARRVARALRPELQLQGATRSFDELPRTLRVAIATAGRLMAAGDHVVLFDDAEEISSPTGWSEVLHTTKTHAQTILFSEHEQPAGRNVRLDG